ncbi:MAG TPA: TetR family transcriptional regulator, partial [Syntrophobacteraceae bacterium]|nr:TetR family transcriptional regulator [Syntrophobacteraceae bacterium]
GLAIIDRYVSETGELFGPILSDESLPPLERVRKSFEILVARFETNECNKGCLLGNLSLEMSDQYEKVRQRLEQSLQGWARVLSTLLLQAQEAKAIPADLKPEMLAENLIASFQGAVLRAKVKKSSEPMIKKCFDHWIDTLL